MTQTGRVGPAVTERCETTEATPRGGVVRYLAEVRSGIWFTGVPRAGRWREILGRFAPIREHRDDPLHIVECVEADGRIHRLCVEIADRRADKLILLRHVGAPFAVRAID